MPLFEPTPSDAQWFYWILPGGTLPLISKWPHAGSNRVNCLFHLEHGKPKNYWVWSASRWAVEIESHTAPFEFKYRGWLDVEPVGQNHLFGSTGYNSDGWECTLDIQAYDPAPQFTFPGVVTIQRWQHETQPFYWQSTLWFIDFFGQGWEEQMTLIEDNATYQEYDTNPQVGGQVVGWYGRAMPECFSFPTLSAGPGFAEGNGVDAYIQMDTETIDAVNRWRWEADVYLRSYANAHVMVNSISGARITGINETLAYWRSINIPYSPPVPLNEWHHIAVERSWQSPVGALMKIFVDGQERGSAVRGNPSNKFDGILGARDVVPKTYANMDIKNLILMTGSPEAPLILLNMPMIDNACQSPPQSNNGTTHNMALPSCV